MIKILIVDHNKSTSKVLKDTFSYIGYKVYSAHNTRDAAGLFQKNAPQVVFINADMPGRAGLKFLKEIKKQDASCRVIMISDFQEPFLQKQCVESGAMVCVTYPFYNEDLRTFLSCHLHLIKETTAKSA